MRYAFCCKLKDINRLQKCLEQPKDNSTQGSYFSQQNTKNTEKNEDPMCPNVSMWFKKNSPQRTRRSTEKHREESTLFWYCHSPKWVVHSSQIAIFEQILKN